MEFEPTELMEEMDDLNPVVVLLMACLADLVNDLARLHRIGAWKDSPREIGPWLRRIFEKGDSQKMRQLKTLAEWEWMLWDGRKTESLCENLEEEVGLVIDPGRIVELAKVRSAEFAGKAKGSHVFTAKRGLMGGCRQVV